MKNRFFKLLSIFLSITMIFSVGSAAAAADTGIENAYYAMSGGTGDGKTPATPAATVYDAVTTAIADGFAADDTVTVYVMQKDWTSTSELTCWTDFEYKGVMQKHSFELVVKPYNPDIETYLLYFNAANKNAYLKLGGPTVFENITIVSDRQNYDFIALLGNSVTFGNGVKYGSIGTSFGTSVKSYGSLPICLSDYSDKTTYTDPLNITFNNIFVTPENDIKNMSIYLGAAGPGKPVFAEDVNLTFNNPGISAYLNWGNANNNGSVTFNKNVNIDIKSASSFTNNKWSAFPDTVVAISGAVQVIVNSKTNYSGDIASLSKVAAAGGIYQLKNKTGTDDILSFTQTAGVYAVKAGYDVLAVKDNGTEYVSSNGYLTVPAGNYTVTAYTPPVTANYYIINGGTGDGRTAETPAASVYDAVSSAIADGLGENDAVTVYIMQKEWTSTSEFTYWTDIAYKGTMQSHPFKLTVKPYNPQLTTYLMYFNEANKNAYLTLGGPTEFENITIVGDRNNLDFISLAGNSLTFNAGTKFGSVGTSFGTTVKSYGLLPICLGKYTESGTYTDDINLVFNNKVVTPASDIKNMSVYLGSAGPGKPVFTGDVNLTFDNPETSVYLNWGNANNSG